MFKWPRGARDAWGEYLTKKGDRGSPFDTMFDVFYLFFITGIGANRRHAGTAEFVDLVDRYPSAQQQYSFLYAGIVLLTDIASSGIPVDKLFVQKKVELLLSDDRTRLSPDGYSLVNEYAAGGYEFVVEVMGKRPETPVDFLLRYNEVVLPKLFSSNAFLLSTH